MTKFGKCETCRARKIKCDEGQPKCGACSKKGRRCFYKNAKDSIFIHETLGLNRQGSSSEDSSSSTPAPLSQPTPASGGPKGAIVEVTLQLKNTRRAKGGQGEFSTFGPRKIDQAGLHKARDPNETGVGHVSDKHLREQPSQSSPRSALLCPQTRFATAWSSIFGYQALDLNPFGETWIKSAWLRTGEDAYLDLATEYTFHSMLAFQRGCESSLSRAYGIGNRALQRLQEAITCKSYETTKHNLVIAIMLHYAAGHFTNLGTFDYIPHLLGVCKLLESDSEGQSSDDLSQNIRSTICIDEVLVSSLRGKPSAFEKTPRPFTPRDGPYEVEVALRAVEYLIVRLSRLSCLARLATQQHSNKQRSVEAGSLLKELFNSDADIYARKTLNMHTTLISCPDEVTRSPNNSMLDFDSQSAFVLATRYYLYRVFICGVIQRLSNADLGATYIDIVTAQQEDIAAATSIAMSLDYAWRPGPSLPLTALGILIPMQLSYGSWLRLQRRQDSKDTLNYQRAIQMKIWTTEHVNELHHKLNGRIIDPERTEKVMDCYAGGPFLNQVYDYINVDDDQG